MENYGEPILNYFSEPLTYEYRPWLSAVPHTHQNVEMIYVVNGACTAYVNQHKEELRAGDLFVAGPNQVHYYENAAWSENGYVLLLFDPSILHELEKVVIEEEPVNHTIHIGTDAALAKQIMDLARMNGAYADFKAKCSIGLVMAEVLPMLRFMPFARKTDNNVARILSYCRDHYREELSIGILAEQFHLSHGYISRIFSHKVNMSFTHFMNALRVRAAMKLLIADELSIVNISEEVGYTSLRTFNRAFMQIANTNPSEYRRLHRKKPQK